MISAYFSLKCEKALAENVALYQKLWNDPENLIKLDAEGALVDAAKGGMAGLASFARDYMEQNAEALLFAAADAAGFGGKLEEAYALAQNTMAMALMFNNDLVFRMVKEISWECMKSIRKKDEILMDLANTVKELHLALASLIGTGDKWDDYYAMLRDALRLIASAETDLTIVANTFKKTDYWLGRKFDGTIPKLEEARDLICPQENNPAIAKIVEGSHKVKPGYLPDEPDRTRSGDEAVLSGKERRNLMSEGLKGMQKGLQFFYAGLSDDFPFPTTEQQWQATMAIGRLTNQLLIDMQGYFENTLKTNLLIDSFCLGLASLKSNVPGFLKKFTLNLMYKTLDKVTALKNVMSLTLNGEEGRLSGPATVKNPSTGLLGPHKPTSVDISVKGYQWVMEINLILQSYKAIPTETLSALSLDQDAIKFYEGICKQLSEMGTYRSYKAVLRLDGGKEQLGELELQILAFALEANNAVISSSVQKGILDVSRTILSRLELSLAVDSQIYEMMESFYYYELPLNDVLDNIFDGLTKLLGNNGFDRALGLLVTGQYAELFVTFLGDNGAKLWTYAGAALMAVALLKQCLGLDDQDKQDQIADIENELNSDADLFNVNFSIDFNLAILKNLQECVKINTKFKFLSPVEVLCAIAKDIKNGNLTELTSLYDKMLDSFSFK